MFLFIMETMQYILTQHNSVFIAEKQQFYPFPLAFNLFLPPTLSVSHTPTHTHTPFPHPACATAFTAVFLELSVVKFRFYFLIFLLIFNPLQNKTFISYNKQTRLYQYLILLM